jgi:hypothetical protein
MYHGCASGLPNRRDTSRHYMRKSIESRLVNYYNVPII